MRTTFIATLGLILLVKSHSSPTSIQLKKPSFISKHENAGNYTTTTTTQSPSPTTTTTRTSASSETVASVSNVSATEPHENQNRTNIGNAVVSEEGDAPLVSKNAVVINLDEINKMSFLEYAGRRVRFLWDYLVNGSEDEPQSDFVARCIGMAKKIRQLIPIVMIGGGVIATKLAFLVLFSLKTLGLVGLLLLLNVASIAAKLGAFLASKKGEPQNLHVHVQPWKSDEHIYSSSSHLKGPPYGWDDRNDPNIESHDLYNLYEKLKFENNFRRYLSSSRT